jgi:hypothetical protein
VAHGEYKDTLLLGMFPVTAVSKVGRGTLESVLQYSPWPKKLVASSITCFVFLFYLSVNAVVFSELLKSVRNINSVIL